MKQKAKWVAVNNIHLTLKFFGEIEETQVEVLSQALSQAASENKSFSFSVKGIGAFPSLDRPRVLWAGIEEGSPRLEELSRSIEDQTLSRGFAPSDKPFSSHLTLTRFISPPPAQELKKLVSEFGSGNFGRCSAEKIFLIRSTLQPSGPVYNVLKEFELGRSG